MLNMLKFKTPVILISLVFFCQLIFAQKLLLDGKWKYNLKDDSLFSSSAFNDAGWKEKSAGNLIFSEEELNTESRNMWLRKKVVIPSSFKKQLAQTGALSVFLGRIYQTDQVFFNGKLIGKTNSSDIKRAYLIDAGLIKWDEENTFAIQMHHWGDKAGIESPNPYLGTAQPANIFELTSSAENLNRKQPVNQKPNVYKCTVINRAAKTTGADIGADFYDLSNKKIATYRQHITLSPGRHVIKFPYQSNSAFLKIHYELNVPQYKYTASWNDEFGYDQVVYEPAIAIVPDKAKDHFTSPELQQQVIKGWLGDRMEDNEEKRLYEVDETAILAGYINKPGDHPWIGEHVGKFLDAACTTYKNTGSPQLRIQLDRTAQQLIASQLNNGYLGTYTPDNYWTSWDVWSHKYNIIGLLSYYSLSGFSPALNAAKKAGDLLCKTFGYNKGQLDIVKAGSHVGMAATCVLEPMVDLYRYTGDKKYLDFCYYIIKSFDQQNGPKIISTLDATTRVDKTANAKAYEMLSNLVGIVKLYKVTGDERFLQPVLLAWDDIVKKRLYITGTASSFEHFQDDDNLPATDKDNMGEGCVTVTWIQLNYQLLCIYGEMKFINELERSVYNHLTGAENPENGAVSYYTPLIGIKPYRSVITCCMSSVPRGIAMIPLFANGKIDGKPSFLFYQPGTYTTEVANKVNLSFTTITKFPADGNINIKVNADKPVQTPINFRKPYWANEFSIIVNGEKQVVNNNDLLTINRLWKKGDNIAISFKIPVRVLDGGRSYPGYVALQRGPQVLAFDNKVNGFSSDKISIDPKNLQLQPEPAVLPAKWLGGTAYQLKASADTKDKNIILVPYADASQTGGSISTWIKKDVSK